MHYLLLFHGISGLYESVSIFAFIRTLAVLFEHNSHCLGASVMSAYRFFRSNWSQFCQPSPISGPFLPSNYINFHLQQIYLPRQLRQQILPKRRNNSFIGDAKRKQKKPYLISKHIIDSNCKQRWRLLLTGIVKKDGVRC